MCPPPPWEVPKSIPQLQGPLTRLLLLFCLILDSVCVNSHVCTPGSGSFPLPSALHVCTASELWPGFLPWGPVTCRWVDVHGLDDV